MASSTTDSHIQGSRCVYKCPWWDDSSQVSAFFLVEISTFFSTSPLLFRLSMSGRPFSSPSPPPCVDPSTYESSFSHIASSLTSDLDSSSYDKINLLQQFYFTFVSSIYVADAFAGKVAVMVSFEDALCTCEVVVVPWRSREVVLAEGTEVPPGLLSNGKGETPTCCLHDYHAEEIDHLIVMMSLLLL